MPEIKKYTRQVQPRQMTEVRAGASSFGGNQQGAQQLGQALTQAADTGERIVKQINTREDVLARARESEQYHREVYDEYNKTISEGDLLDPAVSRDFNQRMREKTAQYIAGHGGSADSKAKLEAQLLSSQSRFIDGMNNAAFGAQQKFIMTKASEQMASLSKLAYQNPDKINDYFKEIDTVLDEYSPAMLPEDEIGFLMSGHEQIAVNALNAYVDSGRYEEAKSLINENPYFMESLRPDVQRNLLQQIQGGINARDKEIRETRSKLNAYKTAAEELGVDVSPQQVYTAVTGIKANETPSQKIDAFANAIGKQSSELTPSIIAKIGFGVDLPKSGEIDYNKEYTPNGRKTPKGIGATIQEPVAKAAAAKEYQNKVTSAINLFEREGNTQALLSAMITFQKALDDGAVVREGDITLQRSAQGLVDQIKSLSDRIQSGQVVSSELVSQMRDTMNTFTEQSLNSSKKFIDPYLSDARESGYRMLDIGLPQEAYNDIFGGVLEKEKVSDVKMKQIEAVAKQNGVTIEQLLESTAAVSGKTVEEVKKDFGIE